MGGNPELINGQKFQKMLIADASTGNSLSAQYPLPVDGDSVHAKDIDSSRSVLNGFDGLATDFFDNLHSENKDISASNPKSFTIHLHRTTVIPLLALGSSEGGNFSNVKVIAIVSGDQEFVIFDNSTDNTKRTSRFFQFPNTGFNAFRLEFHTIDPVSITNIYMPKLISVVTTSEQPVVFADAYNGILLQNGASSAMNVNGSVTPVDFKYTITGLTRGLWFRSFIELTQGNQEFISSNFAAITDGLLNGVDIIVVRNGIEKLLENWKTNMDISLTMFDFSKPFRQGEYVGRWTFLNDMGSPISLFDGDEIILRVKDDLTLVNSFRMKIKLKQ